ncbi:MAG: ABC transporter permease subunit [Deltaproteobacteria bacterium]|nr:ABC transporter permease subunit [Deltaproteobacteria bacterium]
MTAFWGITAKELKIAFTTPVAYIVFLMFSVVSGGFFLLYLQGYEISVQRARHFDDKELFAQLNFTDLILNPMFASVLFILLIAIPLLTMRSFAEEHQNKSMELLLTSPIGSAPVILAKFTSLAIIVACITAMLLVYPVTLQYFGQNSIKALGIIDWPSTLLSLFGVFLAGSFCASIGMVISSLTTSQIQAAISTFGVLFLLWTLGGISGQIPGWLGEVLFFLSPPTHFTRFNRGLLDAGDLLYFGGGTCFFLFFTSRVFEGQRWA